MLFNFIVIIGYYFLPFLSSVFDSFALFFSLFFLLTLSFLLLFFSFFFCLFFNSYYSFSLSDLL